MSKKSEKLKSGRVSQQTKKRSKTELPAKGTDKPLDFGGIPDRNLKKNLGC
jgi:hypothetical protein